MISKKQAAVGLFVLSFFLAFTFSGSAAVEIDVWHSMSEGYGLEIIEELGEEFSEEHDDIDVNVSYSGGYQETLRKAQAAMSAGDPPNISQFEQTRGAAFVDAGALEPLEPYFEQEEDLSFDDFYDSLIETAVYDDTVYGIPYNVSTPLLYYNNDLFEEAGVEGPPETWDELLEVSQKITSELDDVYAIDFYPWGWLFEAWAGQNGCEVLSEDGSEFALNSPECVEAMEFTQDLVHEHDVATHGSGGEGYDLFFSERLAMAQRSTAALSSNIESSDFDMRVAETPKGPEGGYVPIGGGNFFMFDTGSDEEKEASWEFLKFIIRADNLATFAAETGYMASRKQAYNHEILQDKLEEDPRFQVTYDQLDYAHPRPKVPFWGEIDSELEWLFDQQFAENGDVKEALDEIKEEGDRLLRVYRLSE